MEKEKRREINRLLHEKAKPAYAALMKCYPLTLEDLDGEIWRKVEGYDDYYISNFGRLKSFKWKKPCIRRPALFGIYLGFSLYKGSVGKPFFAHKLVAQAFIPNPEGKPQINHRDGIKFNNHVENLEWVTARENMQHAYDTGLHIAAQGVERFNAKIKSESDIIFIRDNPEKLSREELAERFAVSPETIRDIQCGGRYKNVGGAIRNPKKNKYSPPVQEEIKREIRAKYKKGVSGCGCATLAKEYGHSQATIWRIINEK